MAYLILAFSYFMETMLAAKELVRSATNIDGVEILWNGNNASLLYNSQVVATLHFHSANVIVELLDLSKARRENWRRFEYADPVFPDNVTNFICELAEVASPPPPIEVS